MAFNNYIQTRSALIEAEVCLNRAKMDILRRRYPGTENLGRAESDVRSAQEAVRVARQTNKPYIKRAMVKSALAAIKSAKLNIYDAPRKASELGLECLTHLERAHREVEREL